MGGLIALLASLEPGMPRLAGLVLMGPLVKPDPASASRLQIFLAKVASKILPGISRLKGSALFELYLVMQQRGGCLYS